MANNIPLSGLSDAAGGILLPEAQGGMLTNGLLQETGVLSLAGDARSTSSPRESWVIWGGAPTAEFVGEGGTKPVTGAEFSSGTLNAKKIASIVLFTDEQIADVQNGDMNVLVDSGVRDAISDVIDAHGLGMDSGTPLSGNFDSQYTDTTQVVNVGSTQDAFAVAISAAMGSLEANGYRDFGVLTPADFARHLRDARITGGGGGTTPLATSLYQSNLDPLYGAANATSTNLSPLSSGGTVGIVVSRPNVHVRIRQDVTLSRSNEATVGGTSLWQNDLTGVRYVTRLGLWIHDVNRAVVKIVK
jgi:HK97 family phage major capsid protein